MDSSVFLQNKTAAFGWVLVGNQNVLVHGARPVDGLPSVLSSTRVELFGIVAPNEFLFHFMKYYKIELMSKVVKCIDNHAAISCVNQTLGLHSHQRQYSDDIDIVTVIVDCMKGATLQHHL
jgi:hypothetical protein